VLVGRAGDLVLRGGGAPDRLFGREGLDLINGGVGDDTLTGGDGEDTLGGAQNDDSLAGGRGDDRLNGGAGADTIGYDQGFGRDVVFGFTDGVDKLDVSDFDFAVAQDVIDLARQAGNAVVIDFDLAAGDQLVLGNFDLANLDATDILI
jgi:Ca2+-binding RTX toxin-like protein